MTGSRFLKGFGEVLPTCPADASASVAPAAASISGGRYLRLPVFLICANLKNEKRVSCFNWHFSDC